MTTVTNLQNSTANNAITANKPKFLVKDATVPFFSPLERYLEKVAKVAGLELITLCNPRLYVANGLLHVTRVEGSMPNDICRKYEGLALELAQSATSVKDITKEYDDLIVQMLDGTFIALGLPNIFDDNNPHNKDC